MCTASDAHRRNTGSTRSNALRSPPTMTARVPALAPAGPPLTGESTRSTPTAVARAAMDSGVATRPIRDWEAYRQQLMQFVYHSGLIMRPVFEMAKQAPKRVVYAEGEDERVLRAVQVVVDEGLAKPVLIGRPEVVSSRIKRFGLRIAAGKDFEIVNPESDTRYRDVWSEYHRIMGRHGVTPDVARARVRQHTTLIGAMLLRRGETDAMLCGTFGTYDEHLEHVADLVGLAPGRSIYAALNVLLMPNRTLFVCDTYVNENPSAAEIAEMTIMAAEEVLRFGQTPKVALLSHSNFGSSRSESARKMALARELLAQRALGRNPVPRRQFAALDRIRDHPVHAVIQRAARSVVHQSLVAG